MSPTRRARVATIILNYDSVEDTIGAVNAVRMSNELDQRLIVVDNNPDPRGQAELSDQLGRGIDYIATGENLGYAAGNNVGIRAALMTAPEFIWILNPDVRVEPDTLSGLINAARLTPDAGIIGGRILHGGSQPRSIWFDGGIIDAARQGATSHINSGRHHEATPPGGIVDVDYVTGACMLIRSLAAETVGLIPEDYFLYFEEAAYCVRMQKSGWRTVVDQRVTSSHFKKSSGFLPTEHYLYYMTRNRLNFANTFYRSATGTATALTDFMGAFLEPWRARVASRAPHWLGTFDEIVAAALSDAALGKTGKAELVGAFPEVGAFPDVEEKS
jgi:GT2 family glycosyltransferase